MAIKPNAGSEELSSPFFKRNQEICHSFQQFIDALGGKTIGSYNAWSFNVKGKVQGNYLWIFQLKKSTYSSGNLFLSTKFQTLYVSSVWKCKNLVSDDGDFTIRKKKFFDVFRRSYQRLENYPKYVISTSETRLSLSSSLVDMFSSRLKQHNVVTISYSSNELLIQFADEKFNSEEIRAFLKAFDELV